MGLPNTAIVPVRRGGHTPVGVQSRVFWQYDQALGLADWPEHNGPELSE